MEKIRFVFCGRSGSGKTTVASAFRDTLNNELSTISNWRMSISVSLTTREPRPGEINGVDYIFTNKETFENMIKDKQIFEYTEYNGDYYGTAMNSIINDDIFILDAHGVRKLCSIDIDDVFVIYLKASKKTIKERMLLRGDTKESIKRKMKSDKNTKLTFKDIKRYNAHIIHTDNKSVDDIVSEIIHAFVVECMNKGIIV